MKRFVLFLICALLVLSGCSDVAGGGDVPVSDVSGSDVQEPDRSVFGVAHASNVSCDPYTTENRINSELTGLLCEGLFAVGENFEAIPVLCSEYSCDGGVYTFWIKDGVTFSDGSALTARDVAYSLNCAREPDSYYANRLSSISEVRAMRNGSVTVTLSRENGRLPALLDVPIIKRDSRDSALPIGTGLYMPSEDGSSLIARSDHHSGKTPLYNTINIVDIRSTDELVFEFESGNVSLITNDPTGQNALQIDGAVETKNIPTTQLHYIGFNTQDEALADSSVRRAIARAIDRESAASSDFARMGTASALPVHPRSSMYNAELADTLSYDSLTRISVSKPLTILVNSENSGKLAVCKRIAESLTALGAPTTVRALAFDEYVAALTAGDFTLYYAEVALGADFDVTRLIDGPLNYGGFADAELSALNLTKLRAAEAEGDFLEKFCELCPFAPIMFKDIALTTQAGFFSEIHATQQNVYHMLSDWKLGG